MSIPIKEEARLVIRRTKQIHRRIHTRILRLVKPMFYESGFQTGQIGNSRPYRLYALRDSRGKLKPKRLHGKEIEEVIAFAEDGIVSDAEGGVALTTYWGSIPLGDMLKLLRLAQSITEG